MSDQFVVLIHDEFDDHAPHTYESFDNLTDAYTCYKQLCATPKLDMYDDGVELVLDTDDDERITLDYYSY